MQHFKASGSGEATAELESFLAECGRTNSWDQGAPVGTVIPAASAPGIGVKRPLLPNPTLDPSKRPRISVPVVAPGGPVSLADRLAAARASGAPRPMVVRPTG